MAFLRLTRVSCSGGNCSGSLSYQIYFRNGPIGDITMTCPGTTVLNPNISVEFPQNGIPSPDSKGKLSLYQNGQKVCRGSKTLRSEDVFIASDRDAAYNFNCNNNIPCTIRIYYRIENNLFSLARGYTITIGTATYTFVREVTIATVLFVISATRLILAPVLQPFTRKDKEEPFDSDDDIKDDSKDLPD